jgi:hypothetical protein
MNQKLGTITISNLRNKHCKSLFQEIPSSLNQETPVILTQSKCLNDDQNENKTNNLNFPFHTINNSKQNDLTFSHTGDKRRAPIKKMQVHLASQVKRNFKVILVCLLGLIFLLDSHPILFFHVKIKIVVEDLKQMFYNQIAGNIRNSTVKIFLNDTFLNYMNKKVSYKEYSLNEVYICVPNREWYKSFIENTWVYLDMIIVFLIPFITMTFSFIFTFVIVKNANQNYVEFLSDRNRKLNRSIYERKINRNKRIVLKLFLTNVYFLASILPYYLFVFFLERNYGFLKNFVMCLFYSNNALNFLFYGITCARFREELCKFKFC